MANVEDKRTAILEATLRLISEHGFHGTAMAKVAKEAGVSAGIIYHYFANKDELIVELYKDCKKRLAEAMQTKHDDSLPLRAQIRNLWGAMIRECLKSPQATAFISQFCTSPYYTLEVEKEVGVYFGPISGCFEKAISEMIIKDFPKAVYGTLVTDVPTALARKEAAGQIELTDELVEEVVESLWQAIRL